MTTGDANRTLLGRRRGLQDDKFEGIAASTETWNFFPDIQIGDIVRHVDSRPWVRVTNDRQCDKATNKNRPWIVVHKDASGTITELPCYTYGGHGLEKKPAKEDYLSIRPRGASNFPNQVPRHKPLELDWTARNFHPHRKSVVALQEKGYRDSKDHVETVGELTSEARQQLICRLIALRQL